MTSELQPADREMRLRYSGTCRVCRGPLPAGTRAVYERSSRTVRCVECRHAEDATVENVAGASARREYQRRKEGRETRIRERYPRMGGLILALSDDPQSTQAWEQGAIGEEMLAKRFEDLPATTRMLHDRRIPGSRANIDHIVITPAGVWVVDAKRYKGKRPALEVTGGIFRPRVESLRIGGRDGAKLVARVKTQVSTVASALDGRDVRVAGVLCFLEADWPLLGGGFAVDGIDIVWPRLLVKRLAGEPDRAVDVDAVHARLAEVFRAA